MQTFRTHVLPRSRDAGEEAEIRQEGFANRLQDRREERCQRDHDDSDAFSAEEKGGKPDDDEADQARASWGQTRSSANCRRYGQAVRTALS